MSFFSGIASAEHTFASWAEKELAKIHAVEPKIEQVTDTILTYAGAALETVVTAEAGATAGALVGKVVSKAQSSLTAVSGLVSDFGASPSVASIVGAVQSDLGSLLTAAQVTNPKSVATVTKVANELGVLATALKG
jgi:hypothetical protein